MDSLLEWLKTWDWNALLATIVTFASLYGGSIVVLIIGLIKTRLRNLNFQETLEKTKIQISQEQRDQIEVFQRNMLSRLEALEASIIQNNSAANQERIKILKDALEDADKVTAEIEEIPVETEVDANSILDKVGD
ncbi:MAG: hypothetical protein NC310_00260 [Roseburia sp.]|nr:hypothetical protein [Anaeroplasma bactoclasticum]MCM1195485.1 hypothetical protein [Roseburia sp.]